MINILGTYECKVDAKGRFMFPSQYKRQMGDALKQSMVLKKSVSKKCLELFPNENWKQEMKQLDNLNMFNIEHSQFATLFMDKVGFVDLDVTGRLLIPKPLQEYSGITKEIVLISLGTRIEIWDKATHKKTVDINPDVFAALAERVLGGTKIEQ